MDTRSASVPEDGEKIIEIQLERLRTFKNHPFKVRMDQEMIRLSASVEKYGIINPLIVRPIPDGVYEIISGHRRKAAAEKFGYRKVPVIIRVMSDDEAVINMVDSNLQRQQITFSEKAFMLIGTLLWYRQWERFALLAVAGGILLFFLWLDLSKADPSPLTIEDLAISRTSSITDAILELTDYDSQWNTITVDFGDVGKVVCDKDSIKENEAGGRYFPSENFTLK